jgi:hypothetical protein
MHYKLVYTFYMKYCWYVNNYKGGDIVNVVVYKGQTQRGQDM